MAFLIIAWLSVSMLVCLALLRAAARPLPPIQEDSLEEAPTFVLAEAAVGEEPDLAPRAAVAAMLSSVGK
jgi:hypothetical protein